MGRGKPKARQPEMTLAEVFDECQRAATCHRRHVSSLVKHAEADAEGFKDEFRDYLAFVLSTKTKGRPVDLCLQFVRLFLVKIPDASAISEPVALLEEILLDLASWCETPDKLARQRVATLLAQVSLSPFDAPRDVIVLQHVPTCMR